MIPLSSRLFIYFIYRVVHSVWTIVQKWVVIPLLFGKKKSGEKLELHTILFRHKYFEADIARNCDFIGVARDYEDVETLLDVNNNWVLYTFTDDSVYFVQLTKPLIEYNALCQPFVYAALWRDASQLGVIGIDKFLELSKKLPNRTYDIIYSSNTPRSGTTLLTKLLHHDQKCVGLQELPVFTMLAICRQENTMTDTKLKLMLDATFRFYMLHVPEGMKCVMKTRSNGIMLSDIINETHPDIKQIFMYRRDVPKAVMSTEKMMTILGGHETVFLHKISPTLCYWLIGFSRYEQSNYRLVNCRTNLEFAWVIFASGYARFLRNAQTQDFVTNYEDLMADQRGTLEELYKLLGLPTNHISTALQQIDVDSQQNTTLSREAMASVAVTQTNTVDVGRAKDVAELLGLNRNFFMPKYYIR